MSRDTPLVQLPLFERSLPSAAQTDLFRVIVAPAEVARAAWKRWHEAHSEQVFDLMHNTPISLRGQIPLLSDALASHRLEPPAAVSTLMRTLVLKEGLRTRAFWRVSNDVLDILEQADLAVLVLKGAVLAGSAYSRPRHRHCHDLDLLLEAGALEKAERALCAAGFARAPDLSTHAGSRGLRHADGLPVMLHSEPVPGYPRLASEFWSSARKIELAGRQRLAPSTGLLLLQVAALAMLSPRPLLFRWVSDLWFAWRQDPGAPAAAAEAAGRHQLSLVLAVPLRYLAKELDQGLPPDLLQSLTAAARVETEGRNRCLDAVWQRTRGDLSHINWMLGGRQLYPPVLAWLLATGDSGLPGLRTLRLLAGATGVQLRRRLRGRQ